MCKFQILGGSLLEVPAHFGFLGNLSTSTTCHELRKSFKFVESFSLDVING